MNQAFVHLHVHSEFSLVDSIVRLPELVAGVASQGMPAVAVTDQCNLFGAVKFYKAALEHGVKPIFGADVWVDAPAMPPGRALLTLLCRDDTGFLNLKRLITRGYEEGQRAGVPVLPAAWLTPDAVAGITALSGAGAGELGFWLQDASNDKASAYLASMRECFAGDYHIELQRTGRAGEELYIERAVELASREGCALVATADVRFIKPGDYEVHEARVCIQSGYTLTDPKRPREYSEQQYLRTPAEMGVLFRDLPEALDNTVVIAQRCNVRLQLGQSSLPEYEVPQGETAGSYLADLARAGLASKLESREMPPAELEPYQLRLARELGVIEEMGFPGYFLIVADFIRWARENGVPVGPGRGSGAGSLVAWVVGITDVDPLPFDLLFERFLNPERISMPDFDIDFCMEGRDRVIEYVGERYGRDRVSQIITYGTMGAKAVLRDVGRVMGQPYGFADRIARLVPQTPGMTLAKAFEQEPELGQLVEQDAEVRALMDVARPLEGLARNAGTHAGGVVIAPSALTDFAPLYRPEDQAGMVTQFDMKDVESVGLVKFDFLGLRTLTIIESAITMINAERTSAHEAALDLQAIPMDDPQTYALLQSARTHAVFQLESSGMRDLIKRLRPDCFDDIVALVALYRPGPLQSGMVDTFIQRKHADNEADIDYLHPSLEPVLKGTYGVILYQEQVMQAAQVLAGYSLGQADLLRRAMGKKIAAEMEQQREIFMTGAVANGVNEELAKHIFGLMEKFAEYGFNKSHSVAYALLAYQTAWLKAHYPAEFLAAVFSADMEYTDKLALHYRDCKQMGLALQRPDVNASGTAFAAADSGRIRYGLGALKGVGRAAADAIVTEREAHGPYVDLFDLCTRVDSMKINKRALETLVKSGAMDSLGENRPSLLADLPVALGSAEQYARARASGQNDMFGETAPVPKPQQSGTVLPRWSPFKLYMNEYESLGFFLSGHPFDQYRDDVAYLSTGSISGVIRAMPKPDPGAVSWKGGKDVTLAGLITDFRKRGNRVSMYLDDGLERVELSLYAEQYQAFRHLLDERSIRVVTGKLRFEAYIDGWRLAVKNVQDIDRLIEQRAQRLEIHWLADDPSGFSADMLRELLAPYRPGRCAVAVVYTCREAQARLVLGSDWQVRPSAELRERLAEAVGMQAFRFDYEGPTTVG